ncbi:MULTISPECIES: cation:proton antiporter [Thermotoga]|uniref:Multiple resistance and pH regulation protein F n=1 Tax=Thermotoga neapolitana (strain ATCC 49049 / DSM 4359 / NBRC 107923 / NS-E) TaxID=309803 RepID=B9K9A8_THENN|nr:MULTISPECIES: cation:proton antiporter [Thermotoga]MDK2786281.1 multicomponent Na+:H+ antiporter subunit [Thermotoga sp.]HBF10574.1 cation:proton antiporter [Thermotoga neapolitana]ACM23541.1 Multiple resistance and pH regulation protein F [Thermotoga neapolitana DSM 4359]AJG41443.1 cation:proton antiporter [Thermotoga sp. RQ7]KFZ21169.1 monovalent cation/H+ antiporter subunit F [Thermotoga neapolitana LA10]
MTLIFFVLVSAGVVLSFIRIIAGPTSSDRVAALDTMNVMLTGLIVVLAYSFDRGIYLDIALVYALLSFLETIIVSRYLEGRK